MLAVLGALFANGLITILEFIATVFTGSSGMMAESLHSLADTTNRYFCCSDCVFIHVPRRKNIRSVTAKSDFSGLLSPRFLFSESVQPTPFTKASKKSGIRTRLKIWLGHTGFWEFRLFWKPVQSVWHFIRKSKKRITKDCLSVNI